MLVSCHFAANQYNVCEEELKNNFGKIFNVKGGTSLGVMILAFKYDEDEWEDSGFLFMEVERIIAEIRLTGSGRKNNIWI